MSRPDPRLFPIDRTGVALIVALVILIGPATIFAGAWVLTHGLDFGATTTFELVAAILVTALALLMIRAGVTELAGGLGVTIDEQGVRRRGTSLAWAEVERVEAPTHGVLEIAGAGKTIRLRTYLFCEPNRVIDYVTAKTEIRVAT